MLESTWGKDVSSLFRQTRTPVRSALFLCSKGFNCFLSLRHSTLSWAIKEVGSQVAEPGGGART